MNFVMTNLSNHSPCPTLDFIVVTESCIPGIRGI